MMYRPFSKHTKNFTLVAALPILFVLLLPLISLLASTSYSNLALAVQNPTFLTALSLSIKTSLISLVTTIILGTPLALFLSMSSPKTHERLSLIVELPIVLPPAVVGIALLYALGQNGLIGQHISYFGITIPFSTAAVVIAQISVSSPFYIQSAQEAFKRIDPEVIFLARTLGASPLSIFLKIILPLTLPGLISGAAMTLARALGEFGATLLFAGNLPGKTQTVPLAIYTALESDLNVALAFSLILVLTTLILLLILKKSKQLNRILFEDES